MRYRPHHTEGAARSPHRRKVRGWDLQRLIHLRCEPLLLGENGLHLLLLLLMEVVLLLELVLLKGTSVPEAHVYPGVTTGESARAAARRVKLRCGEKMRRYHRRAPRRGRRIPIAGGNVPIGSSGVRISGEWKRGCVTTI